MRILVTGAAGLLGSAVTAEARRRGDQVTAAGRERLDVRDRGACRAVMRAAAPDVVVHCAAYTDVDGAEVHEELALEVNRDGVRNVMEAAGDVGAVVVYPSTDYVFDGRARQPYREDHPSSPLGAYGRSKLAGEEVVRAAGDEHLVLRTSWLYGAGGRNFVDTIRRLAGERDELRVVGDQRGRPTWSASLAVALLDLVHAGGRGTLHACDAGDASWDELAGAVIDLLGLGARLVPVTTAEWGAAAPRPTFSVLALERAEALLGRPFPHWRESLRTYLRGDR
jgi:dTDP-4-dehydrorhamnose reductase